jgi:hypothetical protein
VRRLNEGDLQVAAAGLVKAVGGRRPALSVVRQGEIVVVRAVGAQERLGLEERLRRRGGLNIGVNAVQDGLDGLPEAYRETSLAEMTPLEFLTLRSSNVARRLTHPAIAAFVREDRERGGLLLARSRPTSRPTSRSRRPPRSC